MKLKKLLRLICCLLLIVSSGPVSAQKEALDFSLDDIHGQTWSLGQHLKKDVVLLNFWATYCIPCRAEMQAFQQLYLKHRERGFVVVAVSIDQPQTMARVRTYIQSEGFEFPVLLDGEQKVKQLYNITALPTSLIINRGGTVVRRLESFFEGEEALFDSLITALVAQPAVPEASAPHGEPSQMNRVRISGSNYLRWNSGREERGADRAHWLEDWFDFQAGAGGLAYKMRYRGYQFLQDFERIRKNLIRNSNQRVVKHLFTYQDRLVNIRAGNLYANIGRGLLLRMYEEREARIDKDLKGFSGGLAGELPLIPGSGSLTLFGGKTFDNFARSNLYELDAFEEQHRNTHLQGVDAGYKPLNQLKLGGHYMVGMRGRNQGTDADNPVSGWNGRYTGGSAEFISDYLNGYFGYVRVTGENENPELWDPNEYDGRGLYSALSTRFGPLELGVEIKYYFNYNDDFTDPPNLLKYHSFRLMSRNMLFSNNQREQGAQFNGSYAFKDKVKYAANLSYLVSSPERSPFYVHHVDLPFWDIDNALHFPLAPHTRAILDANINLQKRFYEGEFEERDAFTVGADIEHRLTPDYSIQFVGEVQKTDRNLLYRKPASPESGIKGGEGSSYYHDDFYQTAFYLTLASPSNWSVTADLELTTDSRPPEPDKDSFYHGLPAIENGWSSVYLTYSGLEGHTFTVWGGQRKERVICSGGTCRTEPAFEGVEFLWRSHF